MGLKPIEIVMESSKRHAEGRVGLGIDVKDGCIRDMHAIKLAMETVCMILKVLFSTVLATQYTFPACRLFARRSMISWWCESYLQELRWFVLASIQQFFPGITAFEFIHAGSVSQNVSCALPSCPTLKTSSGQ
jgi:hypothetical protein